ncbi:MAG: protease family protein [Patescibacteria group bacterium]|nr:protease family protein [Patescibacteria group bacterium]
MKKNQHISEHPKNAFWKNPLAVIIGSSALFLFVQALSASLLVPIKDLVAPNVQVLLFGVASVATLFLLLSIIKRTIHASWQSIGLKLPRLNSFLEVAPSLILYFLLSFAVTSLAIKFVPGFDVEQAQDVGFKALEQPLELLAAFITLVVLTPVFEETLFRGVLFKGLRHRVPFWLSAVITSLIFAAAHMQLNVAIDTFALSLILCFLVERSTSIYPAILLHALKNALAFSLLFIFK